MPPSLILLAVPVPFLLIFHSQISTLIHKVAINCRIILNRRRARRQRRANLLSRGTVFAPLGTHWDLSGFGPPDNSCVRIVGAHEANQPAP